MAVVLARKHLADLNIPYKRPNDYFCEHLKTDVHMAKVCQ